MASSNKHWPSMFKSKPRNHHHPWQQHVLSGCEERTPEPKPRWNPRPEQLRILEAIFNSGMVNPPRDEIRKIRFQLQEYGHVGDANVFYWFQNRKSRTKHKQRQSLLHTITHPGTGPTLSVAALPTSSPSSSEKSSPDTSYYEKALSVGSSNHLVIDDELLLDNNTPDTASANQPLIFQSPTCFPTEEPSFFTSISPGLSTQGFCFSDHRNMGNCPNVLLGDELMLMSNGTFRKADDYEKMEMQQQQEFSTHVVNPTVVSSSLSVSSPTNLAFQGAFLDESISPPKTTVFINDVCFEVAMRPLNVRETFGDDAVLFQSSGQPVLTNEWGLTQQPLQTGAFYYILRPFTPSQARNKTIALTFRRSEDAIEKGLPAISSFVLYYDDEPCPS
ncbi:hypothetical protein OROGR_007112 [Orobanche gracilis]